MVGNSGAGESLGLTRKGVFAGEASKSLDIIHSERCFGEHFSSVKQLINRNCQFWFVSAPNYAPFYIKPWWFSATTTSAGNVTAAGPGGDMVSIIGLMYCYFRGSMRIGMQTSAVIPNMKLGYSTASTIIGTAIFSGTTAAWNNGSVPVGNAALMYNDAANSITLAKIPYWNDTRMSMLDFNVGLSTAGQDSSVPTIGLAVNGVNSNTCSFVRSCGEDFQFSGFIGCPPIFVSLS